MKEMDRERRAEGRIKASLRKNTVKQIQGSKGHCETHYFFLKLKKNKL